MPSHYRGPQQEVRALDAYIKLMRAADSITARVDGVMSAAGLTIGQFGVLEALLHLGPLCQRDLGRKLLRSNGNVTVVLNNLGRRGLVRRTRRTDDRRFITVTLTGKGRRLIGGIFPRHVAKVVGEMNVLAGDEQDALGRLCRRLGLSLAREPGAAPHGQGGGLRASGAPLPANASGSQAHGVQSHTHGAGSRAHGAQSHTYGAASRAAAADRRNGAASHANGVGSRKDG